LYTSASEAAVRSRYRRIRNYYLAAAAGTAGLSFLYELFSHHVYSSAMLFAFAYPLLLGAGLSALLLRQRSPIPPHWTLDFYHAGVMTLTVGSFYRGVLEIFGTTNRLWAVYAYAGAALLLLGIACLVLRERSRKRHPRAPDSVPAAQSPSRGS